MNKEELYKLCKETLVEKVYKLQEENQKLKGQYCERTDCGGRLGNSKKVEELIKENEMLHHYKLLYQKVKERNDKAIKIMEDYTLFDLKAEKVMAVIDLLKGENND